MPIVPATQPIPTTMGKEKEEIAVPAEELDRYFLFPSVSSTSSTISKHLKTVHKHLNGTFPTYLGMPAQLHKFLLRVTKSVDFLMALEVKEACQHLAMKLEMLAFNYKMYEECRFSNLKNLNGLSKLRHRRKALGASSKL